MKGNDGTGNNSLRDLWETDRSFWNILNEQYGFTFDCCANMNNTKCNKFSTVFELTTSVSLKDEICWMNPPFSKAISMFTQFFKVVDKGVSIYRCDNLESMVWQNLIFKKADWVFIPKGRVQYIIKGENTGNVRFPSALIGRNLPIPINIIGTVLKLGGHII